MSTYARVGMRRYNMCLSKKNGELATIFVIKHGWPRDFLLNPFYEFQNILSSDNTKKIDLKIGSSVIFFSSSKDMLKFNNTQREINTGNFRVYRSLGSELKGNKITSCTEKNIVLIIQYWENGKERTLDVTCDRPIQNHLSKVSSVSLNEDSSQHNEYLWIFSTDFDEKRTVDLSITLEKQIIATFQVDFNWELEKFSLT
ncbi:MAG: hypothetical protein N2749_06845 [Clostridia bacterium]|nr:hypothetical protein [Clostridia bacterium]